MKFGFFNVILILIILISCTGGKMVDSINYSEQNITVSDIEKVGGSRIYFAHQSVGYNIMDGISEIFGKYNKKLDIFETTDAPKTPDSFFAHSRIGENTKPQTKINEFYDVMNSGMGKMANIAFLKLCYVDINAKTDVKSLFKGYQSVINKLKLQYPNVTYIHFTAPLVMKQKGAKAFIKRVLGREVWSDRDNLRRQEYNKLVRETYSGKEPVLDIAEIESTRPDGSREVHSLDGEKYYSLFSEYTTDGGHLNKKGRDLVVQNLIKVISDLQLK